MDAHSSYVEVDEVTGARWSTFEGYKELISLLWRGASDEKIAPTDGYSLDGRIEAFIREIAFIGRAHNWDKRNAAGKEYDDLEGDKPSCYSGVIRRLLQALQAHPLFSGGIKAIITIFFQEHLRTHMHQKFEALDTETLEALILAYYQVSRAQVSEQSLAISNRLDVDEDSMNQWLAELKEKYADLFFDEEEAAATVIDEEEAAATVIEDAKKYRFPSSSNHFFANVERIQLNVLCQQTLSARKDGFLDRLNALPESQRCAFLLADDPITQESRLLKAIHLELLAEVGQSIGGKALQSLLCKDEETEELYANILADYTENKAFHTWLAILDETSKATLLEKIQVITAGSSVLSVVEKFKMAVRTIPETERTPKVTALIRSILALLSSHTQEDLEGILATHTLPPTLRQKALKMGLKLPDAAVNEAEESTTPLTTTVTTSTSTFEALPEDSTGELLPYLEASLAFTLELLMQQSMFASPGLSGEPTSTNFKSASFGT